MNERGTNPQIFTHIDTKFTQPSSLDDTGIMKTLSQVSEAAEEVNLHRYASPGKIF